MPKLAADRNPKHRRHASGQGVVTLSGADHYTGAWGSGESAAKYAELVGRWNMGGRRRLDRPAARAATVGELIGRYLEAEVAGFRKRGAPTSFARKAARVLGVVRASHGSMAAADFGRAEFRAIRAHWCEAPNRRGVPNTLRTANDYAETVRNAFAWAAGEGIVPRGDWMFPRLEPKLRRRKSRGEQKERKARPGVGPPPDGAVEAARARVGPAARAIIDLMVLTGMRPAEACAIRPRDVDRSGPIWVYRVPPEWNKMEHQGRDRTVYIGAAGIAILRPWLDRALAIGESAPAFRTKYRNAFTPVGLHKVVYTACRKAPEIPAWTPNQLRHLHATIVRAKFGDRGLEMASASLGHADLDTTQIYAERDREMARKVAQEVG